MILKTHTTTPHTTTRHTTTRHTGTITTDAGPGSTLDRVGLLRLAEAVAEDGIEAHDTELGPVLDAARRCGRRPVLVRVVADRDERPVVRLRAFGSMVTDIASLLPGPVC